MKTGKLVFIMWSTRIKHQFFLAFIIPFQSLCPGISIYIYRHGRNQ